MTENRRQTPRWVWLIAKVFVVACVVGWMVHQGLIRLEDLGDAAARWPYLAVALAALLICFFLQSARWGILLRAQGISVPLIDLFIMTMTGLFFTVVAPGGVGGDAVKAYYVARASERKAEAATTVFLDRFLGLATLFFVACITIVIDFHRVWSLEVEGVTVLGQPVGRVLVLAIAACIAGMIALTMMVMSKRLRATRLFGRLSRLVPFRGTVGKVYRALHLYGDRRDALLGAAVLSIAAQAPLFLVYYLYGLALGAEIELWHCALIVPPAMVIRVLPLVPGGAGQGMAAMALLFPLVGVAKGGAIGAVGDAMFMVTYFIGGLFFLLGKTRHDELPSG